MAMLLERTALRGPCAARPVEGAELPFLSLDTPTGPLHARTRRLTAAHRTGRAPIVAAHSASATLLALLALDPTLAACDPRRALYLDTETTGLHGGAGTIAFLVGLAYWDTGTSPGPGGRDLILEQLLVRNLGEEAPMLERVAERMKDASMLVTFNGKSFDLPLLRTRFVMARIPAPPEPPHLDLMHIARRLHRARGIECRLTTIEEKILGFVRQDDVPSGEVSASYLHFLRTGSVRSLLGVVEHNAWDVVAMAALVGLYGEPLEGTQLAAEDLTGLARTLKKAGQLDGAFDAASLAVERGGGHASLRARAEIAKARGDRARALCDFELLADQVDSSDVRLELAKLYEHFVKEPALARDLVLKGTGEDETRTRRRLDRLERKSSRTRQRSLFVERRPHRGKSPP